jgi:hypothetical protein
MILCRIVDGGPIQYFEVDDVEVRMSRVHRESELRAVVPRVCKGWRWANHMNTGVSGIGRNKLEAEDLAMDRF